MKSIDVYEQYFEADYEFNGVKRKGCAVKLTATSEEGMITLLTASLSSHTEMQKISA